MLALSFGAALVLSSSWVSCFKQLTFVWIKVVKVVVVVVFVKVVVVATWCME